jgi:hypothetical protein
MVRHGDGVNGRGIYSPMGLPWESVCWNDRRDCRVGFSSAAATTSCQQELLERVGRTRAWGLHTWLGFVHGSVGIGLGRGVVMRLSSLAVTNFAFVFALLALCRRQLVAAVASKAKVCTCARTLRILLGLCHCRRHVPSFPRASAKATTATRLVGGYCGAAVAAYCAGCGSGVEGELRRGPSVAL